MEKLSSSDIEKQVKDLAGFKDNLVPGSIKPAMKGADAKSSDLWRVPRSAIKVRPGYNPRIRTPQFEARLDELAQSMAANGYFDDKPLGVSIASEGGQDVIYLEDGHRRFEASGIAVEKYGAQLETLPVVTLPRSMSAEKRLVHMVHSNNDGEPFSPLEMAIIVQRLESMGWDDSTVAKELNMTTTRVNQLKVLASSPKEIRDLVKSGEISATLAIETVQQDKDQASEVIQEAVQEAKKSGKKATAKTVKKVREAKKRGKPTRAELDAKALRQQKKHGPDAFALLKEVFDKHGKSIDKDFHARADALFVQCGVI